jgi:UDP-glucose 4-epimerase
MIECLVTGASGFVGGALVSRLSADASIGVRAAMRSRASLPERARAFMGCVLDDPASWHEALNGADCVVHTAARVHVMNASVEELPEFRAVNVEGTLRLAEAAAEAGVRRFVFVSSIKVNGESTTPGKPFRAGDIAAPEDPYAVSKHEAEQSLAALGRRTGLEVAIVRPPLVYGPGVKANFRALINAVDRGVPLPFALVNNRRSLVAVANLADLLARCVVHPHAAGRTFLVSDGEDLSTPQLIRLIATALGRPARLVPVPVPLLKLAGALTGRSGPVSRLCEHLQVDIEETRHQLEWTPPLTVETAIAGAVRVR